MDHGATFDSGTATHHLVQYKTKQSSLVFGAGTVQWSWALDSHHDRPTGELGMFENEYDIRVGRDLNGAPEVDIMQATVNLFADMGNVQPQTLLKRSYKGLDYAIQWIDNEPPSDVSIEEVVLNDAKDVLAIRFRGSDDVGMLSGVEVRLSNDDTWHPSMTVDVEKFSYVIDVVDKRIDKLDIFYRGIDDSSNVGTIKQKIVHLSKLKRGLTDEL